MKICIISHESELGDQMVRLARRLVRRGVEVHAIIRSYKMPKREWVPCGDGVIRHVAPIIPYAGMIFPSYVLSAFLLTLTIRKSVVICREPFTGLIGGMIRLVSGRRNVIYVVDSSVDLKIERGLWKNQLIISLGRLLESLAIRNTDLSIALDNALIPFLLLKGARRIEVIPYGANTELFSNLDRKYAKKRLQLDERRVVLYVGNMEAYHGAQYLAEAVPLIRREVSDAVVVFIGEGGLRREMEAKAGEGAIFRGRVDYKDLPVHLAAADVTVASPAPNSSYVSVLTTKIFDYIAAGRAVVATDVGGIRREFGGACVTVRPGDHEALAQAIIRVLTDDELRLSLEKNARALAETKFNWEKIVDKFLNALSSI